MKEEAKKKAHELVDKFSSVGIMIEGQDLIIISDENMNTAKQCAIIAVDEMINELEWAYKIEPLFLNQHQIFWQQVKEEIILFDN